MKTFSITSSKWEGEVLLTYNEIGCIKEVHFPELSTEILFYFATHFPVTLEILDWIRNNTSGKVIEVVKIDFNDFWNAYKNKEGSKDMAQMYWEGHKKTINKRPLTFDDRVQIMQILPKYVARFGGEQKIYQPQATKFFHQRIWVSEFEKMIENSKNQPYINKLSLNLLEKWTKNTSNGQKNE